MGWENIYARCRAYENGIYLASAMAVPFYKDIIDLRSPSEKLVLMDRCLLVLVIVVKRYCFIKSMILGIVKGKESCGK